MTQKKVIGVLALVTAAALAALYFAGPDFERSSAEPQALMFPNLLGSINEVARVTTLHEGQSLSASRAEELWVVPERGGYAASEQAVHKTIVAMANIRRIEAMTSKPERYAKLGLEAPDNADAYGVQITLENKQGVRLAGLIVGHRDPSKLSDTSNEIFVRQMDEPQAWLVEANVPHLTQPKELLRKEVADLELARVREVRVQHPGAIEVLVAKNTADQEDFTLMNLPAGKEVLYDWAVNDVGRVLTNLDLVDVRPVAEIDFDSDAIEIELRTFDGLEVKIRSVETEQGQFATLEAATSTPVPGQDTRTDATMLNAEQIAEEVASLNDRWDGWAFQFSNYRYGTFTPRLADLVKPGESESQ